MEKAIDVKLAEPDRKISVAAQAIADELNRRLEKIAGQPMAFCLVVFNAQPGSRITYVSNCERADVASALMSLLRGWAEGMPDVMAHEVQ